MAVYTTIDDPSAYFKIQLYTGNGSDNHAITFDDTDTDMQPDAVWIKNRDATDNHCLFDAARGVGKIMHTNTTSGNEVDDDDTLDAFQSDGFRVDDDDKVNTNTEDYVAWCWKAGGGSGSSNTTGTINTTTTTVNTTSKFSISTYTGNDTGGGNFGHGLGAVPHFLWVAQKNTGDSYRVYHHKNTSAPETDYLVLDTDAATIDSNVQWNDTAPSSTIITLGTSGNVNESAHTYVSYAWSEVQGFSKFGKYTGNGNADGPFIYLGFRPNLFIVKSTGTNSWFAFSDPLHTNGYYGGNRIYLNENNVESTNGDVYEIKEFLSNGVKIASSHGGANTSGQDYIYMAFAKAPLVNSEGVPGNAG